MRRLLFILLVAAALPAAGQQPPVLEPIPEPPPPEVGINDDSVGPGVNIEGGQRKIEETTDAFGMRSIRVENPDGTVYFINEAMPGQGLAGTQNNDNRLRVPQWQLYSW